MLVALLCLTVAGEPAPAAAAKPRDRNSEAMMATGGVVLTLGVATQLVGFASLYIDRRDRDSNPESLPHLNLVPGVEIGIGLGFSVIGAVFLGVGIRQHQRWKATLGRPGARLELEPVIGPGLGVRGRF